MIGKRKDGKRLCNVGNSSPGGVQSCSSTSRLDANVAIRHKALPAPADAVPVFAQAARAVLPFRLGQPQLLEHQLDEDAVVFKTPFRAVRLNLEVGAGVFTDFAVDAAFQEVDVVEIRALESQGQLLRGDASAFGC